MRHFFLIVGMMVLLVGCAGQSAGPESAAEGRMVPAVPLPAVPFYPQATHQCGPAALAMILGWSGLEITPAELTPQVYTPGRKGSLQSSIIAAARRHERLAYVIGDRQCLLAELAAGHPVLVLQNLGVAWLPRWHYAVVLGYDPINDHVVMHSGRLAQRRVGLKLFERTWRRADHWGLVVLNPGELPACARENDYLKAAAGLEQAGALSAALTAYQTAAAHWPNSAAFQFALGNASYARGDLSGAAAAFRQAGRIDPAYAPAFNNLAYVLSQQGLPDEAEIAALRAIELGGAHRDAYRRTLEEIRQRQSEPLSPEK